MQSNALAKKLGFKDLTRGDDYRVQNAKSRGGAAVSNKEFVKCHW
jgi:hypothetical protein